MLMCDFLQTIPFRNGPDAGWSHVQVTFARKEVSVEQLLEAIDDCGFDASVISVPEEKAVTQVLSNPILVSASCSKSKIASADAMKS